MAREALSVLLDRECAPATAARVKQLIDALGGGEPRAPGPESPERDPTR